MGPDQTVRTAPASQKVGPLLAVTPGPKQTDRASELSAAELDEYLDRLVRDGDEDSPEFARAYEVWEMNQ